jgi:hypothetical protein
MGKEIEDINKTHEFFQEEMDNIEMQVTDVEMSVKGAHSAILLMQEEIMDFNDIVANVNNQVERIQVEDVVWCHSQITALEKLNNPANCSLWQLVNSLSTRLESQEDLISDLRTDLAGAHEKIGVLEMLLALVQGRDLLLEVMESSPSPTDLTSEDSEHADVNDGGAMMVEDSKDERENIPPPPPILPHQDTPHPAPVFCSLIPIEDPAPTPAVEVVDVDAEGEDDTWYIPPVRRRRVHPLDEFTTAAIQPVPEYVEDRREDPMAGPHRDDLPADGSEDELWANLGDNLRSHLTE